MSPKLSCVYGTVTGKAQSIAEQIVETGHSQGIKVTGVLVMRGPVACLHLDSEYSGNIIYDPNPNVMLTRS